MLTSSSSAITTSLFFHATTTNETSTLSLHDALPILIGRGAIRNPWLFEQIRQQQRGEPLFVPLGRDRKSTRLNSSHSQISYAVFCLKKKTSKACLRR